MAVQAITFFQVPFDNTYKNVYKFPLNNSPTSEYTYNQLRQYFNLIDYPISGKNFRITNNKILLTYYATNRANGAAYYSISKYNYCAIQSNDTGVSAWRFYFITGYSTLNSSSSAGSIELSLEYDCWLNNVADIIQSFGEFTMVQGHVKDAHVSTGIKVYSERISNRISEMEIQRTRVDNGCKILWIKFVVGGTLYDLQGNSYVKTEPTSVLSGDSQLPVGYYPAAVIKTSTMKFAQSGEFTLNVKNKSNQYFSISINKLNVSMSVGGEIVQAEYTYYVPFDVSLNVATNTFTVTDAYPVGAFDYYVKKGEVYDFLIESSRDEGNVIKRNAFALFGTGVVRPVGDNVNFTQIRTSSLSKEDYENSEFNYNKIIQTIDSPFEWYEIEINGERKRLDIPEKTYVINLYTISILGTAYYYFEFRDYEFALIKTTIPTPIQTNGFLQLGLSGETAFYRNQGNQLLAQQQAIGTRLQTQTINNWISLFGSFGQIAGGNINGIQSSLRTIGNQYSAETESEIQNNMLNARKADAANSLDSFSTTSADANDVIYNQNLIIVYRCKAIKNTTYYSNLNNIYKYGVCTNVVDNLMTLPHKVFNYKKYSDVDKKFVTNNQEDEVIRNILTSGTTIWNFMLSTDDELTKISKMTMAKIVNNPCTEVNT